MALDGEAPRSPAGPGIRLTALAVSYALSTRRFVRRRPFIAMFAAGAVSTLAMAPLHVWPVLCLTLPALLWALDAAAPAGRRDWRQAAWRGWAFGFGYHFAGLYWIGFSFLVQAERFAALMPFAILGLTAALGLFFGAAGVAYRFMRPHLSGEVSRVVALALVVMCAEWLRGHILTGLPWNVLGYALTMPLPLMQWAGLFGIYVLTAVTVIVLATPVVVLARRCPRPEATIIAATVAPLAFAAVYGAWQLGAHPTSFDPAVRLRLVQPAFSQRDKFDRSKRGEIFLRHLELSSQPAATDGRGATAAPTHIIWPEAAVPFFLRRNPDALAAIASALPDDVQIIAGTFRINVPPSVPNARVGAFKVYNTAMVLGGDGRVKSFYDKIHLVPFGEYLPAQSVLGALGLENLTRTAGGLAIGKGPRQLMTIAGLPPVEMLICYEASFPGEVVQGSARPGLMINLTNDAWFGATSGPYQHFHQTRVRAVEQGVAMLRSANTGISAIVDPVGRVVAQLALNEVGVVDGAMPKPVLTPIYARYGRFIECAALLALLVYLAVTKTVNRRVDRA